jgi:hypothetical protein
MAFTSRSFLGLCGALRPLCRTPGSRDKPFSAGVRTAAGSTTGSADCRPVRGAGRLPRVPAPGWPAPAPAPGPAQR